MIGAWALIRGNTVLGCFPSTITQHRFSNQETVIKKKTHGPFRLHTAGNFPVRAEISESFKNVAYSKYQPVPQFYFFDRLYGMFCQFVIGLIHRSCAVDQITAFSSFQYKYTIYYLHCMFFLLLVSCNTCQSWFLKHFFITSQFKNKKWRILEITKISHGPPSTIVCKLINLTEAFLTENHLEVRIREGGKDRKLEILRYY